MEEHGSTPVAAAAKHATVGREHYRWARLFLTRAETVEALVRAQAAFAAGRDAAGEALGDAGAGEAAASEVRALREWCARAYEQVVRLRREVEGGGRDELPEL